MFSIIILLFSVYTIYHMWHHVPSSKGWRILVAVGLLLMSLLGVVAYWVYYFIAKPNRNGMDDEKKAGGNASEAEAIVAELTATYENEELDAMARLDEMAKIISRKILVTTFDVGRKCRLLEAVNAYTEQLDASLHNYIHGMAIYNSFCVIEALTQSLIFQEEKSEFLKKSPIIR